MWDTGYAKIHIPIIASVSEHQPTTWSSYMFDLHILIAVFPAGIWFVCKKIDDSRVFLVIYAVFGSYFSGVMVRLMLTLTPCVCMAAGIAFSEMLTPFFEGALDAEAKSAEEAKTEEIASLKKKEEKGEKEEKKVENSDPFGQHGTFFSTRMLVSCATMIVLLMFAVHCCWVTSNAYSSPSVVLATTGRDGSRHILDDFREGYNWLRMNTPEDTKIMSWWDYGYQIAGFANRTTLVDNNTWNNSHIALVGKAMASNEDDAVKIMRALDVDYVLVIFGAMIGYSGDDINKFLWMVRIAEGEHPQDIKESNYFTPNGEYRVDEQAPKIFTDSVMYKCSYYRFGELMNDPRAPGGYDRTRNTAVGVKNIKLKHLEEAYTSENWLVRIYRVKKEANRDDKGKLSRRKKFSSKKTSRKRDGTFRAGSILPASVPGKNMGILTKKAEIELASSAETLKQMVSSVLI
jgi:dolichyl-diphosphooligosaccharide--protein glycosyltransferase